MFRKGGLSRETGIMSGLDRRGYAGGGNIGGGNIVGTPIGNRTGFQDPRKWGVSRIAPWLASKVPGLSKGWAKKAWSKYGPTSIPKYSISQSTAPVGMRGTISSRATKLPFMERAGKWVSTNPYWTGAAGIYGSKPAYDFLSGPGVSTAKQIADLAIPDWMWDQDAWEAERARKKAEEATGKIDIDKAPGPMDYLQPKKPPSEEEKQSIESDFESVYKDILPIFKRELEADPESTAKEKYIALAQFGSRLLGEPGGDLAGAVGRAAEKPLEEVGKIMAKETKAKRSAKEAALTIAAQKYLKDDAVKDKVEGFKKYLPNTSEEEIAKQLLLPAGTENIKLRILEDNKKVFLEHMGDPANVKGGNTYANEQLHMSENQEKFKGINFKKLPIKDSVVKTDKIPEKGDYYINPETGEHGFMSKDGTWTSITEKDFPSFV